MTYFYFSEYPGIFIYSLFFLPSFIIVFSGTQKKIDYFVLFFDNIFFFYNLGIVLYKSDIQKMYFIFKF